MLRSLALRQETEERCRSVHVVDELLSSILMHCAQNPCPLLFSNLSLLSLLSIFALAQVLSQNRILFTMVAERG